MLGMMNLGPEEVPVALVPAVGALLHAFRSHGRIVVRLGSSRLSQSQRSIADGSIQRVHMSGETYNALTRRSPAW